MPAYVVNPLVRRGSKLPQTCGYY